MGDARASLIHTAYEPAGQFTCSNALLNQVYRMVRLRTALPFVFISSSVWGENDRETALALGVTRFLLRPIEPHVSDSLAC